MSARDVDVDAEAELNALTRRSTAARTEKVAATCNHLTEERVKCWQRHGGHGTNSCILHEVREKKCIAEILCPKEARRFYGDVRDRVPSSLGRGSNDVHTSGTHVHRATVSCAGWAEAYVFNPRPTTDMGTDTLDGGETISTADRERTEASTQFMASRRDLVRQCRTYTLGLVKCLHRARAILNGDED
eukprot:GFYU01016350.1.p1 GENE.GFYU01016350.1~~GFYU01016350.1.p1  ORF type:complete len:188 (-),score=16.22 GFYU01016350.1:243-806(-)